MIAPHNATPGQMAATQEESARAKEYLDEAGPDEHARIAAEYPPEHDEWHAERAVGDCPRSTAA